MMCPRCQNTNLMDASAELEDFYSEDVELKKCFACGWRGSVNVPVKQEEHTMGKWSEEARLAFHARKAAAKHEEASTKSGVPMTCQPVADRASRPVIVDGDVITILDSTLERMKEDVTTLMRAKEIVERYQA